MADNAARKLSAQPQQTRPLDTRPRIQEINRAVPLHTQSPKMFSAVLKISAVALVLAYLLYLKASQGVMDNQIKDAEKSLAAMKSDYIVMQMQLEQTQTLENLEDVAVNQYGMCEVSNNQITYIDLTNGNKIEVASEKSWWSDIVDFVTNAFRIK